MVIDFKNNKVQQLLLLLYGEQFYEQILKNDSKEIKDQQFLLSLSWKSNNITGSNRKNPNIDIDILVLLTI